EGRAGGAAGQVEAHTKPPYPPQLSLDVGGEPRARLFARSDHHVHQRLHPRPRDRRCGRGRERFRQYDPAAVTASERELLEQAKEGDLEAFAEFVRVFERRIRSVLYRLLDDARDIDEAVQDTFVQAWRNLDRFRGDAAPYTWLYRIAVNEALMRRRRKT